MKRILRGPLFFLLLFIVILLLSSLLSGGLLDGGMREELSYNYDFLQKIKDGKIKVITITEREAVGLYTDTTIRLKDYPGSYDFSVYLPPLDQFYEDVRTVIGKPNASTAEFGFEMNLQPIPAPSLISVLLPYIGLALIIGVFWFLFMRQQGGSGSNVMSFGKSRARVSMDDKRKVTFDDVEGAEEEKEDLREIVEFLKNPRRFLDLGARIPKGVLLVGPPGTGKTLLAKAIAGEAGVPFFSISGSDFVEMFVGVGASRVRDLFEQAKKNVPCIVFIDEIDAVGRQRGAGLGGGHDEREQTLNQLLVEMDGFTVNEGIIILAATNRVDILDPALLRPGRFDRRITVSYPDIKGREKILNLHAKGKPLNDDVDLSVIAKLTPWFTGADLENVMNEGAILAARFDKKMIGMDELKEAIKRVEMGPEKKSHVVTERDKNLVAYHEAGHAIVSHLLPNCDPVHEVSIIPRGMAGGYTQTLANEDSKYITKAQLLDRIASMMGGHAAEMLVFDDVTTGSSSDLKHASEVARRMITEYGMSDTVGPVFLGGDQEVFIGRDFSQQHQYSEEVAARIDQEMKRLLDNGYRRASELLHEHRVRLDQIANILLEREKIDTEEFKSLMDAPLTA